MKILPIITCRDCRAVLEIETFEEITEETPNTRFTIACPACTSLQNVPPAMAFNLRDNEEAVDAMQQEEGKDERIRKAIEAQDALDKAGGDIKAAATRLSVVPATITNRLKYLPAGTVPSGAKA